jgi:hypothetical protein
MVGIVLPDYNIDQGCWKAKRQPPLSLAYGTTHDKANGKTIVFLCVGGGTFDVCVFDLRNDRLSFVDLVCVVICVFKENELRSTLLLPSSLTIGTPCSYTSDSFAILAGRNVEECPSSLGLVLPSRA